MRGEVPALAAQHVLSYGQGAMCIRPMSAARCAGLNNNMNASLKIGFTALLVAALALGVLVGCGQKGDLYLPDQRPPPNQAR